MISQTLMDKLQQLRLPAFRDGLREQLSNPQYAELSFEERLLLLVPAAWITEPSIASNWPTSLCTLQSKIWISPQIVD